MVIRIAETDDAPKIAYVHVETWRVAYRGQIADAVLDALDIGRRSDMWRSRIKNAHGVVFIAEDRGNVTGCFIKPWDSIRTAPARPKRRSVATT